MASLIDLGQITNQAIQLAQLKEMQRRSSLIERDREIDQQRLAVQREEFEWGKEKDRANTLINLANDPMHKHTPVGRSALKLGLSLKGIEVSEEDLVTGYEAMLGLERASRDRTMTQAEREKAAFNAFLHVPDLARKFLDDAEKFQNMDAKKVRLANEILLQEGKLNDLKLKQSTLQLQSGLYATMGGVMNQMMDATNITDTEGSRKFGPIFQRIVNSKDEVERKVLRSSVKDLDAKMQERVLNLSTAFDKFYEMKNQELRPLVEQVHQAQAEGREVGETELGQVKALELLDTAKESINKWAAQPYDKQAWTRLQNTMREVQQAGADTKKGISNINEIRDKVLANAEAKVRLSENKEQFDQTLDSSQRYGQQRFIEYVSEGMRADKAAAKAGEDTFKIFKQYPDSGKFDNPLLKRTLAISETTPAVETDIQRGLIATESALNTIKTIENVVATSNIGLSAMIKSNVLGFREQITALAQSARSDAEAMKAADPKGMKNFTPSKWFDPNIPKIDLLAHSLTMQLIKSEQGSRPSDKDFEHKVKSLGLQTWGANAPDAKVRLKTLREQMEYQRTIYSRLSGNFADRVQGGADATGGPRTAEEYFRRKGIQIPTEQETP